MRGCREACVEFRRSALAHNPQPIGWVSLEARLTPPGTDFTYPKLWSKNYAMHPHSTTIAPNLEIVRGQGDKRPGRHSEFSARLGMFEENVEDVMTIPRQLT